MMIHSTGIFTYNKDERILSTFASDLGRGGNFMSRIYPDALDQGFKLISLHSGEEAIFTLKKEVRNRDNDVTHWIFEADSNSIKNNQRVLGLTVIVWNT